MNTNIIEGAISFKYEYFKFDQNWKLHSVHFNTTENYEGWFIFISILELPPNKNKDDTRVWKIMPIWIRIVLGLEKSSKYEY